MYRLILLIIFTIALSYGAKKPQSEPPHLGYHSSVYNDLVNLPVPQEKIVVAVYKFRDQTGQYKTTSTGQSWSTAVTQGATSMVLKALENSKWFIPLEREGLSNLLNERKIIRGTREYYSKKNNTQPQNLAPLLYAGVILEGGIISYETNIVTGGFGMRYLGIGGNVRVQKDQVTVFLRAVSTQTGQILKTVHATKTIYSKLHDGNIYKFVRFKKLLEVESGYSYNEPPQMCVQEAIDKAVLALIVEGVDAKLWGVKDTNQLKHPIFEDYRKEKVHVFTESIVEKESPKKLPLYFTVSGGYQYQGQIDKKRIEPMTNMGVYYPINKWFDLGILVHFGKFGKYSAYNGKVLSGGITTLFDIFPDRRYSVGIMSGITANRSWLRDVNGTKIKTKKEYFARLLPGLHFGGQGRFDMTKNITLTVDVIRHVILSDHFDGVKIDEVENNYDSFWSFAPGIRLHF